MANSMKYKESSIAEFEDIELEEKEFKQFNTPKNFEFSLDDTNGLKKKFYQFTKNADFLDKKGFKELISVCVESLTNISEIIFDAILKKDREKLYFTEFLEFFEKLVSNENGQDLEFSFRLVTKNLKDVFFKDDLTRFLKEILKLKHDSSNSNIFEENDIEDLAYIIYEEFIYEENESKKLNKSIDSRKLNKSTDSKKIDKGVDYEKFVKVLRNNENIFLLFKSLNAGMDDFLLIKETENNIKKFSQKINKIEEKIRKFLREELKIVQESIINQVSENKNRTEKLFKDTKFKSLAYSLNQLVKIKDDFQNIESKQINGIFDPCSLFKPLIK